MALRTGLRFPLVRKPELKDVPWIGHPCGAIAPMVWLARRPVLSEQVSRYLVKDAGGSLWNRASFSSMLFEYQEAGGTLDRSARRLVKWWVRTGKPAPWKVAGILGYDVNDHRVLKIINGLTACECVVVGATE